MSRQHCAVLAALVLAAFTRAAFAHEGEGIGGGFASGFLHLLLGWDCSSIPAADRPQ